MHLTPQQADRGRVEPVVLPSFDVWLPRELAGELAAVLRIVDATAAGRPVPAACRQARPSRSLMRLAEVAAAAAVECERARHQAAASSGKPSPELRVVLPSEVAAQGFDVLTVTEAAGLLGVTPEAVRQAAAKGQIHGRRDAGRRWLLYRQSVEQYQPRSRRKGTDAEGVRSGGAA